MKKITAILLFGLLMVTIHFSGCEQEDLDYVIDCDNCMESMPDSADLIVYVTLNDENPFVPLVYYVGNFEDGAVDYSDTAYADTMYLYSKVGEIYSVKATYQVNGEPLVAVDGDKLRIIDAQGDCAPPCYFIRGGTFDLRLK